MKRLVLGVLIAVAVLAVVVAARGARLERSQVAPGTPAEIAIDPAGAAERLAGAIRFATVSWGDLARRDRAAFLGLHDYLRARFPRVSAALTRETVADLSLLYTWPGVDPALPPVILLGHLDVVPAESTGTPAWTHPPFAGVVAGDRVWGRGALDDKSAVLGLLEAVEALLASGFRPVRTVYLAFGHNEEGAGDASGAAAMARALADRGVRGAWLLDEGGLIYDRVPGIATPVALVGIAEKAAVNVELRARAAGGHSSMPAHTTAVGLIARAIDRVERHPMPPRFDASNPTRQMLLTLAPDLSWPLRSAVANLWLLGPIVTRQLGSSPAGNATIRTTIAPTQVTGSMKSNVIAPEATAILNARLVPGDSVDDLVTYLRRTIDDDRVTITVLDRTDPGPTSPIDTPQFDQLQAAIRAVFPEALVAPYLTVGATDAREYSAIAPLRYRFLPIDQSGAAEAIHGVDEHLQIAVYMRAIKAYATIIQTMSGAPKSTP